MNEPIRLSKRLIEVIGCSRREAELYIEGGWVSVDGVVIDAPQHPVTTEVVSLLPGAKASTLEPVTLLFNRPADFKGDLEQLIRTLTRDSHWSEDPSEMRILKGHFARLQSELAPEAGAGGLVVLTQDWRTLRKLHADANKIEQEYLVEAQGSLSESQIDKARRGLIHQGVTLTPCKISWQNETTLRIAVKNPPPGFISQLCSALKLSIGQSKRLRVGGVSMGKLPVGQWRYLRGTERF